MVVSPQVGVTQGMRAVAVGAKLSIERAAAPSPRTHTWRALRERVPLRTVRRCEAHRKVASDEHQDAIVGRRLAVRRGHLVLDGCEAGVLRRRKRKHSGWWRLVDRNTRVNASAAAQAPAYH